MERLFVAWFWVVATLMSPAQSERSVFDKVKEYSASSRDVLTAIKNAADALKSVVRKIPVDVSHDMLNSKVLPLASSSGDSARSLHNDHNYNVGAARHGFGYGARGLTDLDQNTPNESPLSISNADSGKNNPGDSAQRKLKHNVESGQRSPSDSPVSTSTLAPTQKTPGDGARGLRNDYHYFVDAPHKHVFGSRGLSNDNVESGQSHSAKNAPHGISGVVPDKKSISGVVSGKKSIVESDLSSPADCTRSISGVVSGKKSISGVVSGEKSISGVVSGQKSPGDDVHCEINQNVDSGHNSPSDINHTISRVDSSKKPTGARGLLYKVRPFLNNFGYGARGLSNEIVESDQSIPSNNLVDHPKSESSKGGQRDSAVGVHKNIAVNAARKSLGNTASLPNKNVDSGQSSRVDDSHSISKMDPGKKSPNDASRGRYTMSSPHDRLGYAARGLRYVDMSGQSTPVDSSRSFFNYNVDSAPNSQADSAVGIERPGEGARGLYYNNYYMDPFLYSPSRNLFPYQNPPLGRNGGLYFMQPWNQQE